MEELGKRKAIDSPRAEKSASTARHNKTRKINPSEMMSPENNVVHQILSQDRPKGSDLTQKLVSMWLTGSKGHDSLLTQEVRESIALRESQQKCAEAENLIQKMQQKVQNAETHVGDLTKDLKLEKRTNADLIDKINATAEMVSTITEHINYAVDTLERCRHHRDHLSNLYDNIIIRQSGELEKLKNHEETLNKRILDLQCEEASLKESLRDIRISCETKLNERDAKLIQVVAEYEFVKKQLDGLVEEREEISRALSIKETHNLDIQKKISEYEAEVKNLSSKLFKVSGTVDTVNEENSQLKNHLISKNNEMLKLVEDLDSAKAKHSREISSMKMINLELEEKINREFNERESLRKKLNETTELKNELYRQVEKLKEDTSVGMNEMKRRLENAEMEKIEIREAGKKIVDEMEKRAQSQIEKYESLLAEMKALEARHEIELSRVNVSSSTAITNANAEKSRLEKQLDSLRREKEEREIELRQVEDLLMKHTSSEMQLQRKLEQYQSEASASAAAAAEHKKSQDAENRESVRKISDLERELLKLQFNMAKSNNSEIQEIQAKGKIEQRGKEPSARKISAATTYQKSILKRSMKPRKVRSSPSSPLMSSNKRISFMDDVSSSDTSPVKLTNTSNITSFLNSEDMYDEMAGIGKSSSQPLQGSQTKSSEILSQTQSGGKKFFKSRNNQSK